MVNSLGQVEDQNTLNTYLPKQIKNFRFGKSIHFNIDNSDVSQGEGDPDSQNNGNDDAIDKKKFGKIVSERYNEGLQKGEERYIKQLTEKYGITPDDFEALSELKKKQKELEEEKLIKKEQFEELLKKKEATFQEQKQIFDNKLKQYEENMKNLLIGKEIISLASKHGAYDAKDIEDNLNRLYSFSYDPKTLEKQILKKDGSLVLNQETGEPLTIEDAVLKLKSNPEKKHLFKPRNINGTGINSGNTHNIDVNSMSGEDIMKDPVSYIKSIMKDE